MKNEKHPAEIALALLRDFPEIDEARMAAEGSSRPQDFRKFARPIIDAYFGPLGEKVCRAPAVMLAAPAVPAYKPMVVDENYMRLLTACANIFKQATGRDISMTPTYDCGRHCIVWMVSDDDLPGDLGGVERFSLAGEPRPFAPAAE